MKHDQSAFRLDGETVPLLVDIIAEDPRISSRSSWSSKTWYIDGETGGHVRSQFAISWGVKADQSLVDGMKLVAALLFFERDGKVEYKHSTASTFSSGVRHLLRFMEQHFFTSFAQLDEDAYKLYVKYLHRTLSDPALFDEQSDAEEAVSEDEAIDFETAPRSRKKAKTKSDEAIASAQSDDDDDRLSYAAAYYRLRSWRHLWQFRREFEQAGMLPIAFNAFEQRSLGDEATEVSNIAVRLIPPLPDEVALAIMSNVHRMIKIPANDVIELQERYIDCMARLDREPTTVERARIRRTMESFEFSLVDGKAWHEPIELSPDEAGGGNRMRELIVLIRDAAVQVIFSGTGCRISEVCSLVEDPSPAALPLFAGERDADELPACVSRSVSKTGLNDHFFMHGFLYKNERTPKPEKWLIGARPMGDTVEPPVLRAIRVLQRLYAPWRKLGADEKIRGKLILGFRGGGLPRSSRAVGPIGSGTLRMSIKKYVREQVDLAALADLVKDNKRLAPYVATRGANIRTHQWRKTFALYMMRVDDRMIPEVARQICTGC